MEIGQAEVAVVLDTVRRIEESVRELNDLELAVVGGGVGEVSLG